MILMLLATIVINCVCVCVFCSLQEVYAAPHRFIIDMAVEDSWSHLFMSSLAPRGYLKVQQ